MDDKANLHKIRHSASHIMAQALLELFPDAKLGTGPAIEDGFYYDFDLPHKLTPEDLPMIEARMRKIISGHYSFVQDELSVDDARNKFMSQPFKLDLIDAIARGELGTHGETEAKPSETVSVYQQNGFMDLCAGPHVEDTGQVPIDGFKLLSIAGAYWRGDENRPQLQRIYGTAWQSNQELQNHLQMLEQAKQRDHRKLGRELEIFIFEEEVGPGLPLWLPNGGILIDELEELAKEMEIKRGYVRVRTPHITKEALFLRSGHLPYYAESMYPPMEMEGVRYYLKPMNCPFHHKIFASKARSYRDLPLRMAEYGTCYRYEKSGELFGLMRVRSMQMNDAHLYVAESQFEDEFMAVIGMYLEYFRLFGIERYIMRLSTHAQKGLGKKYVDNERLWLKTEEMVRAAMRHGNVPFFEVPDEAAFYGPKIDVQIWSAIGREFTLATNQVDFAVPPRFDLKFTNELGQDETPLCIHRAPLSTHERFIGFLLEHYAGNFPIWLAPEQVRVIAITDSQNEYALHLEKRLQEIGIRCRADTDSERVNKKIRNAQLGKVPYMLIAGAREASSQTVSLRKRDGSRQAGLPINEFLDLVGERIASRSGQL